MANARWAKPHTPTREEYPEEAIARYKWDRKGKVLRQGTSYRGGKVNNWIVRHSLEGRSDQYDILFNGEVVKTAGERKMPSWVRKVITESEGK